MSATPNAPVEGSYTLDGMLQGPLPPEGESVLQEWLRNAEASGFRFSLEVEGGQFSLLCDTATRQSAPNLSIVDTLTDGLDSLIKIFPAEKRRQLFSTIRSTHFEPDTEVQAMYPIATDGSVQPQVRNLESRTVAPAGPVTRKDQLKLAAVGLGVALSFIAISAFFIPYDRLSDRAIEKFTSLEATDIVIDNALYEPYFMVVPVEIDRKLGGLVVNLIPGPQWAELSDPNVPVDESGNIAWSDLLRLSNLKRGYIPVVIYNREDRPISTTKLPLTALRGGMQEAPSLIVLPRTQKTHRIELTW